MDCALQLADISRDTPAMSSFSLLDAFAFLTFVLAWFLYHRIVESERAREQSLNGLMDRYRKRWIERLHEREERIFDTQVMAGLQNGTAFFASTSLFAFGGAFALLRGLVGSKTSKHLIDSNRFLKCRPYTFF